MRATSVGFVVALGLLGAGCAAEVPEGKQWTVDTAAWSGSQYCASQPCALDAYVSRDFTTQDALPGRLVHGTEIQVHCFVPTPAPQRDPAGRDAYRWYLLTVDGEQVWAPDLALTSEDDVRRSPDDAGDHLSAGLDECNSAVPGR